MPEVIAGMVHCGMGRLTPVAHVVRRMLVLAAVGGCSGRGLQLGDGPAGVHGDASTDGSDANSACPHAQVGGAEVLWIGDSWVTTAEAQHVRDLARAAGAIGPNDDYAVSAAPGTTMVQIAEQYNTYERSTNVKVLIMDGGGWDTILSGGSDASVTSVGQNFTLHLATVANNGTVQDVIYFLYPELSGIPGVAALRPVMQQACAASTVPCYFLDLNPLWAGHPEYTDSTLSSNLLPSDAGAQVIADNIWDIMQRYCIAQ